MPEMDGFEFLQRLREQEKWRSIPVIVLTATKLSVEDQIRLHNYVETIFQKESYSRDKLLSVISEQLSAISERCHIVN